MAITRTIRISERRYAELSDRHTAKKVLRTVYVTYNGDYSDDAKRHIAKCPSCKHILREMVLYKNNMLSLHGNISPYCPECGQKLDWDESAETKNEAKLEWIPTAQDKPTESGDYIVYDTSVGYTYVYEFNIDSIADASYWRNYITHWMPVPAAPVTKKGE